jgi:transposase
MSGEKLNLARTSLEDRIAQLETTAARLDATVTDIIQKVLPKLLDKIRECNQANAPRFRRNPRTKDMYDQVQALYRQGHTIRKLASELRLPYATAYRYVFMAPEDAELLPMAVPKE